jgi:hypothetical protein
VPFAGHHSQKRRQILHERNLRKIVAEIDPNSVREIESQSKVIKVNAPSHLDFGQGLLAIVVAISTFK